MILRGFLLLSVAAGQIDGRWKNKTLKRDENFRGQAS